MQTNNDVRKGQYSSLVPEEIGKFVANFRKRAGWKQLTLAFESGIHERTVQRIEHGERVDNESLRKVAKALRLEENAFIGLRYVPTKDEAVAETIEFFSEMTVIEVHSFTTLKDCEAVLRVHGSLVDDLMVSERLADRVAAFKDLVTDWGNLFDDLPSEGARLDACRSVLAEVKGIEGAGYRIRYGVYTTEDKFTVAVFVFLAKDDESLFKVTQLVVPRSFHKMAAKELAMSG